MKPSGPRRGGPALDLVTVSGETTEKGLLKLEQNPNLTNLTFITPNPVSDGARKRPVARLPRLVMFRTGRDLQHTSPQMVKAAIRKTR